MHLKFQISNAAPGRYGCRAGRQGRQGRVPHGGPRAQAVPDGGLDILRFAEKKRPAARSAAGQGEPFLAEHGMVDAEGVPTAEREPDAGFINEEDRRIALDEPGRGRPHGWAEKQAHAALGGGAGEHLHPLGQTLVGVRHSDQAESS